MVLTTTVFPNRKILSQKATSGIYWGPHGEYINTTWTDNKTKEGFTNMSKCVVDEYNEFCVTIQGTKYCVDGTKTLAENIADNGGVSVFCL